MSYAAKDHVSAIRDLIAFNGKMISIGGQNVRAIIEGIQTGMEASEFGLDNREETLTATMINRGFKAEFGTPVIYKGRNFRITEIDTDDESVLTVSLTNDD
mgnify:CR=1 FL=1